MLNDERSETESSCLNLETACTQSTIGEKNITKKQAETSCVIDRHISDSPRQSCQIHKETINKRYEKLSEINFLFFFLVLFLLLK